MVRGAVLYMAAPLFGVGRRFRGAAARPASWRRRAGPSGGRAPGAPARERADAGDGPGAVGPTRSSAAEGSLARSLTVGPGGGRVIRGRDGSTRSASRSPACLVGRLGAQHDGSALDRRHSRAPRRSAGPGTSTAGRIGSSSRISSPTAKAPPHGDRRRAPAGRRPAGRRRVAPVGPGGHPQGQRPRCRRRPRSPGRHRAVVRVRRCARRARPAGRRRAGCARPRRRTGASARPSSSAVAR